VNACQGQSVFLSSVEISNWKEVIGVQEKTQDLLKKFEQDHEIYVSAQDAQTFWMVNARIPKKQESHHRSRKYISGPNENGNVLIFPDHEVMDVYLTENWGTMKTFEDFVDKALTAILSDKEESDQKLQEGYGTSCEESCMSPYHD
jgi:hypothetical protein